MTRVTTRYEYKVVPAPRRGEKTRGAKQTEDRFAHALASLMNKMGREGWDYLRAETLPCEERTGLTGRTTTFQNMLVFRRIVDGVYLDEVESDAVLPVPEATDAAPGMTATLTGGLTGARTDQARTEGPRLVSSREDEGGKAPAVGPARGDQSAD